MPRSKPPAAPKPSAYSLNSVRPTAPASGTSFASSPLKQAASERADVRDGDGRLPGHVALGQVDLGADGPVVVAIRVVEHLAHAPERVAAIGVDVQQCRVAGVAAGADAVVLAEVGLDRVAPAVGVPAGHRVEFAEIVVAAQCGKLHPAEHGVADEH